jgi:cytochrome c-type biogenesis protein CcmF
VRVYHEPMVPWIWFGSLVMMVGGFTSLSDRRYRVGAPVKAGGKPGDTQIAKVQA